MIRKELSYILMWYHVHLYCLTCLFPFQLFLNLLCIVTTFICDNLNGYAFGIIVLRYVQRPTEVCQAIFRELKDAFWLKFEEIHRAIDWPTFLESVEGRPDAILLRKIR